MSTTTIRKTPPSSAEGGVDVETVTPAWAGRVGGRERRVAVAHEYDAGEVAGFGKLGVPIRSTLPDSRIDVVIDFSQPAGTIALLPQCVERSTPLEPGRRYAVTLSLRAIGQVVPAGYRLRLALSTTYWPWVWPSPDPATAKPPRNWR